MLNFDDYDIYKNNANIWSQTINNKRNKGKKTTNKQQSSFKHFIAETLITTYRTRWKNV